MSSKTNRERISGRCFWPSPAASAARRQADPVAAALRCAENEGCAAPALFAELMALPPGARLAAVHQIPRFASLGLAFRLLAAAADPSSSDPAAESARLALAVAGRLAPEHYPRGLICDVRGRAWALIAAARVRASDLPGAAKALARAVIALRAGTGDPLEEAHLLEQAAFLRRRQGRRFEAHRLEREAREIYLETGQVDAAAALGSASRRGCRGDGRPAA